MSVIKRRKRVLGATVEIPRSANNLPTAPVLVALHNRMRSIIHDPSDIALAPSHRVLFIPELLDIIFGFLDRDTNVTNACVCKQWSEIALDVVWKEVNDLLHLFRLLKPISDQEDTYEYVSKSPFRFSCFRLTLSSAVL